MPFLDPTGRSWRHVLRAQLLFNEYPLPPEEEEETEDELTPMSPSIVNYILDNLTLDLIDETGRRPDIEYAEFLTGDLISVFWDYNFTPEEIEEFAQKALPEQHADGLAAYQIGKLSYDDQLIEWHGYDE